MQQRQRRQLIRRIEQTVQFAECPAAHRHHLAGHQLFAAIAGPLPNPEADRQIGGVAQVIAVVGVNHIDVDIRIFAQKAAQPRNEPAHAEQRIRLMVTCRDADCSRTCSVAWRSTLNAERIER